MSIITKLNYRPISKQGNGEARDSVAAMISAPQNSEKLAVWDSRSAMISTIISDMRILIINQAYWPDVVATAQHMTDWAEQLAKAGHEVHIIASRSVYGQQGGMLPRKEEHNRVKIHRVGINLFRKGGILTRLIDFGTFHFLALIKANLLKRPEVVVCLTTPPFIGVIGRFLQLFRGCRYVQYEMDLYPDVPVALGVMKPDSFVTRRFEWLHRHLLRKANKVVVLGRCMRSLIASKDIPDRQMVLVTPWADPDEIVPVPRATNAWRQAQQLQDKFIVMYSGNLGLGHDISTICLTMERLFRSGEKNPADQQFQFVFIGGGKRMKEIEKFATARQIPIPLMLPYQPREKLSETLSAADVHLITQAPGTTGLIVPSKFYGILAAGRPSLYIGPADTEVALSIREDQLGLVVEIGNVDHCVDYLRQLRDAPEQRTELENKTREICRTQHSQASCGKQLTEMLRSVLSQKV